MRLKQLYQIPGKTVITAHRGFSGSYPENTLTAFRKAVELGVDIVEFDVRETSDGRLIILHDATLDRTTDGTGTVDSHPWSEVSKLNATYWEGPSKMGYRLEQPSGDERIPLLTDALELLAGTVGLNIQVYTHSEKALEQIATLYLDYGLEDSGFLMLRTFAEAEHIRRRFPQVALCVGEERDNLERHLHFGVDFMQPRRAQLDEDLLSRLQASAIPFNVFDANTEEEMRWLLQRGVRGIMTDVPDQLLALL